MKYILFGLLLLFAVPILATRTVYADVIITEIMYDPEGGDSGREWVEIMNDGSVAVDMQHFRFFEADTRHRIKESVGSMQLEPGAVAVIVQDSAYFKNDFQQYHGAIFLSSFSLRQQGEQGELLGMYNTAADRMEHQVTYAPDERTGGTGASLHLTLGNTQVPAPATPGTIAINPIPETVVVKETPAGEDAATEEEAKKTEAKETVSKKVAKLLQGTSDAEEEKSEVLREDAATRYAVPTQAGKDYTNVLRVMALFMGIIIVELWVVIRRLRRRSR